MSTPAGGTEEPLPPLPAAEPPPAASPPPAAAPPPAVPAPPPAWRKAAAAAGKVAKLLVAAAGAVAVSLEAALPGQLPWLAPVTAAIAAIGVYLVPNAAPAPPG